MKLYFLFDEPVFDDTVSLRLTILEDAMRRYTTHTIIEEPNRLTLSDVPFSPGQRVAVLVIAEDEGTSLTPQDLRSLLKTTQALPQVVAITEEEIVQEIAAYRAGHE